MIVPTTRPDTISDSAGASAVPGELPLPDQAGEDWDFAGQDTQYGTHGLHTYVAAMIPALARRLIDCYAPPGGVVLDPFCGGGAVVVETIHSGRTALGRDINPLAVMVARAKSAHVAAEDISACGKTVLAQAREYDGPPLSFNPSDYVEYWFKGYMLQPLTGLRKAIDQIEPPDLHTLFKVLFSGTVRSVSLTHRNEVRLRRLTGAKLANFNPDVFEVFSRYLNLAQERVPALPPGARARIERGNTRQLNLRQEEVDTIVCSPPYGDERNGVNYTQFAKNMLYWLGYDREQLRAARDETLGWGKEYRAVPPSLTLDSALARISGNPRSVREAVAFYADYYQALREMVRVTRGRIIIVIGNRVLNKQVLDNAQVTIELMNAIGVPLEKRRQRKLPTKRLPRMREAGAAIDQEGILVFRNS